VYVYSSYPAIHSAFRTFPASAPDRRIIVRVDGSRRGKYAVSKLRIMVIDNHPLFRKGVRWSLEQHIDLRITGESDSCHGEMAMVDTITPDVVIIGTETSDLARLEFVKQLRRRHPQTPVVILSSHDDDEHLFHAIRAGAAAYASKQISGDELAGMIRRVGAGEYLINDSVLSRPNVASRVLNQFRELSLSDVSDEGVFSPLTPREIEILDCVAQGNSNKEIAKILGISDQTVKNHITSILRKLAVNDRTQAVIYALKQGWISLDDNGESDTRLRVVR
jgi:DNA-binding NarL/FixJ family response regulator